MAEMADPDISTPILNPVEDSSSAPEASRSLSQRINAATRSLHGQLNRRILLRLPLALPPHSTNSSKYVSGLLHIAPIYIAFESLWQSVLNAPCLPTNLKQPAPADPAEPATSNLHLATHLRIPNERKPLVNEPKISPRTQSLLSHLRLPGLLRAQRLRLDIQMLTGATNDCVHKQLEAVSKEGNLAQFIVHTKASVEKSPHVLLAYAWVLYMALFSGGRFLRVVLREAGGKGRDFWDRDLSPVRPYAVTRDEDRRQGSRSEFTEPPSTWPPRTIPRSRSEGDGDSDITKTTPGLQFFDFSGDQDGEDIKLEFKNRIAEAELLLTDGEKEDIVIEAQHIFKFMLQIVNALDAVVGTNEEDTEIVQLLQKSSNLVATRDSVAVAHERLSRKRLAGVEKQENHQSNGYQKILVTGPVAKVVQFTNTLPAVGTVVNAFQWSFLRKEPTTRVSLVSTTELKDQESWIRQNVTLLPLLLVFGIVLFWNIGV